MDIDKMEVIKGILQDDMHEAVATVQQEQIEEDEECYTLTIRVAVAKRDIEELYEEE